MIAVEYATEPTPGRTNEDYVLAGPTWLVLLDGATAPVGVDSGCLHDVPWLVRHLGGALAGGLTADPAAALDDLLADAIRQTCAAHADTCDLTNPASPSSTVVAVRHQGRWLDYLSLADSSVILDLGHEVRHVVDDRTAHLADYSVAGVQAVRNTPSTPDRPTFWVASTVPEAAHQAVTGRVPAAEVRRAALLTDGASRWVDRFHLGCWDDLLHILTQQGPAELIRQVRAAEHAETAAARVGLRGKRHDDATAALIRFTPDTNG